jgi:hypothetical protein
MNFFQKYLNSDNRRKLINYLRPSMYHRHPELKVNGIPTKRWKLLITMRDLRLWINENAPFSSRSGIYQNEIFRINNELNYLQTRGRYFLILAFLVSFVAYISILIYFFFWSPKHYRGAWGTQQGRPV